ncbi:MULTISPECIES: CPBP family intramembrane glutamic endopeptidase [Chryseobacterium]|jgi:membrane protease YdiL (CAAX protease family)|uniref:Membrane protease YdiL (CAAX protease family) n=1 Tax=Chryseobacterium geocarposphaerae TaxID=1416776 RepID=A0ABU1L9V0_9FLAO|nr:MULTISPECIES: type II CAAX endopeptidase family protein [Chryseobacterium]ALR29814.1 CAAX protease [Chryseobacterium sp. IHB B 17019]MDR6403499.1 membrane protease YdiL (CAAX protease family) [Chryseobacterium geocarposphaerae]MDR6697053.1 membrane protease YdiL (CAAX protease family) [Chryseobacterium ginsenosidimutans]
MENSRYPKFTFTWIGGLVLLAGLFVGTMVVSFFNVFWMFVFKENLQFRDWFFMLSNAAGFLTAIAFFDFFIVRRTTGKKLNFNFSPTNFYTYLLIFPLMIGMMFIAEFIAAQIPTTGPFFGKYYEFFSRLMEQLTDDPVVMIITAVICAPIFEEIIFRGIIQKGLINKGVEPWKAIFFASIIFGLVHANPWQFVGAILLGCVLGLVYFKTKSLLLPMLLHGFNNLCSSLLILYTKNESFADAFKVSEWIILAIGIILFSLFYYLFMKNYKVHYAEI